MGPAVTKLVFQPPKPASYTNTPNFFWLYTIRHQKIPAFFINRDAEFTILFSHGNAEGAAVCDDDEEETREEQSRRTFGPILDVLVGSCSVLPRLPPSRTNE